MKKDAIFWWALPVDLEDETARKYKNVSFFD
jgi:hypothetical protein